MVAGQFGQADPPLLVVEQEPERPERRDQDDRRSLGQAEVAPELVEGHRTPRASRSKTRKWATAAVRSSVP